MRHREDEPCSKRSTSCPIVYRPWTFSHPALSCAAMDVLGEVLSMTRITSTIFCQSEMRAPWGMSVPEGTCAAFHVITRGSCWYRFAGEDAWHHALQGDVILLPSGRAHVICDDPNTVPLPFSEVLGDLDARDPRQPLRAGGSGAQTSLICGAYSFEHDGRHPLLSLLPPLVHISGEEAAHADSIQGALRMLNREIAQLLPGSDTVISRLVDVMFVLIVRAWVATQPESSAGWLGALRDAQIGKALAHMHRDPRRRWTVDTLAAEVSMSRAAFAKRFTELVGEPPLTYLTGLRMDLAGRLLRESPASLPQIAERVGYESEFAFSRAFRRARGISPGRYRTRTIEALPVASA